MASLLLDVEGTLLDSRAATLAGLQQAWRELYDTPAPDRETVYTQMFQDLDALYPTPELRALASQREVEWLEKHPPELFPGVAELLASPHRFALVTLCSRPYTQALVRVTGLSRWLHCWFCADDSADKADLVKMALRELGRPAYLLGDRPSDLAAARAHKVEAFGAGWSYSGADLSEARAVLAHPLDLLRAIE